MEHLQASLRLAEATGDVVAQGDTLSLLGWYYGKLGQVEQSVDFSSRALEMLRDNSNATSFATAVANLAGVLLAALDSTRLQTRLAHHFGVNQDEVTGCTTYGGHGEKMAVFKGGIAVSTATPSRANESLVLSKFGNAEGCGPGVSV